MVFSKSFITKLSRWKVYVSLQLNSRWTLSFRKRKSKRSSSSCLHERLSVGWESLTRSRPWSRFFAFLRLHMSRGRSLVWMAVIQWPTKPSHTIFSVPKLTISQVNELCFVAENYGWPWCSRTNPQDYSRWITSRLIDYQNYLNFRALFMMEEVQIPCWSPANMTSPRESFQ